MGCALNLSANVGIHAVPGHDFFCKVEHPPELACNALLFGFHFLCAFAVPEMVAPLHFIVTPSNLSYGAVVWSSFHSIRSDFTKPAVTPFKFIRVTGDSSQYFYGSQGLVGNEDAMSQQSNLTVARLFSNLGINPIEAIISQNIDLVKNL